MTSVVQLKHITFVRNKSIILQDISLCIKPGDFFGISNLKDRAFNTLSNGEQQKTIIARALMPHPGLLVLDEPCAGLDLKAREELFDSVQKICDAGPTLIFITHRSE